MKSKKLKLFVMTGMLLLVLSLVVTACGTKEPAATTPPEKEPTSTVDTEPTGQPEVDPDEAAWQLVLDAAAKEGKLVANLANGEYVRNVVAAFEEHHPEIKVEYTQLTGRDF